MKKFLALSLTFIAFICFAASGFCGCSLFGNKEKKNYVYVSDLTELKAAKEDIRLTQDIDCDFATVSEITCKSVDGQGHTIKNAVLIDNPFFITDEVSNITFENITCRAVSSSNISIVASAEMDSSNHLKVDNISMENVTVKNSTVNMPQSNFKSIYASVFVGGDPSWNGGSSVNVSFKNCYAENVTMRLGAGSISSIDGNKEWGNVYFGGFFGKARYIEIENCGIEDCDFSAYGRVSQAIYGGGLVGYFEELRSNNNSIKDSYVKNTYVTACAPNASLRSAADVCLGGLAGYYKTSGTISQSYSSNNHIGATCSGKARVGGLVGHCEISGAASCYASDNFIAGVYVENGEAAHEVAGLFASAKGCTLNSCFTYNNQIQTDETYDFTEVVVGSNGEHYISDTFYSRISGFIASGNSVTATFCAAYNSIRNTIGDRTFLLEEMDRYGLKIDDVTDEFWFGGTQVNCYVTQPAAAGNSQGLSVIEATVWITPNEIKSKLNLAGGKWVIEENKAPYLAL